MGEEADYDDREAPRSPSLWEVVTGNRPLLWGAGLLLSFISCGSSAATVDPAIEVWRSIIMVSAALLAVAAFATAIVVKPRS
jgi:hypothetical protein